MIGRPVISSCSLANAIALPEKETAPTNTPKSTSPIRYTAGLPGASMRKTTIEMSAAAPPPTPLKMATIWGIAVIFTMRAAGTAMTAPMTIATRVSTRLSECALTTGLAKVNPTASAAAAAPTRFPLRACFGELNPLRARMNPMIAIR